MFFVEMMYEMNLKSSCVSVEEPVKRKYAYMLHKKVSLTGK